MCCFHRTVWRAFSYVVRVCSVCSRIYVAARASFTRLDRLGRGKSARTRASVRAAREALFITPRQKSEENIVSVVDNSPEFDAPVDRRPLSSRAMDVEPQYPVDAATQDAMQDGAGGGGAPDATNATNLDEYMRESGGVKKSRGGRGPGGERLKVRAVIVKRTSGPKGPTGGGRGGRGRGPSGGAPKKVSRRDPIVRAWETPSFAHRRVPSDPTLLERSIPRRGYPRVRRLTLPFLATSRISQRERVHKREDGFVAVHIYGKDVILVAPTGEVRLDAAGDTGHNTFRAMNESLNKFGFKLSKSPNDETQWTLGDGKRFLKRYEDGMTIPAPVPPGPGRALALMQRDDPPAESGARAPGGGFGARSFGGRGFGSRGRGFGARGRGRY